MDCSQILFGSLICALAAGAGVAAAAERDPAEAADGFQLIFNGRDLSGWSGDPRLWSVREGAITGQTTAGHPAKVNTFLIWTNGAVRNFELRCRFKLEPNNDQGFANSGIQYRSQVLDPAAWAVGGYQADMEAGTNYTGILYEEKKPRGIMALRGEKAVWDQDCKKRVVGRLSTPAEIQAGIRAGDWNDYVIVARDRRLEHFVNGKQTVEVVDDCPQGAVEGVVALQLHVGPPMTAQFKDLRLKPLP